MLTTILTPTGGDITLNGHDAAKDANEVRHSFGIVFQDPSLDDDLTAIENMNLHGISTTSRARSVKNGSSNCLILSNCGIGATA